LAKAITAPSNPLTARVIVNRVWAWHFGVGLVRTPSDFGLRTEAPVQRELLDWLAARFIADGWSLKKLHRLIMRSAVYHLSARVSPVAALRDPDNARWSHALRQRLDFESMRDALLSVSGQLDRAVGGQSVDLEKEPFSGRRTLYGVIDRQNLPGMFRNFDFASPDTHTPQRFTTTVPQQSLFLMNATFVVEQARALAAMSERIGSPAERIRALYRQVFAREPSGTEVRAGLAFIEAIEPVMRDRMGASTWSYGYAAFDPQAKTVSNFTAFPTFAENSWRGGYVTPDPTLSYAQLAAGSGHPGRDHTQAVVRRWTAPFAGTFSVSGSVIHAIPAGDGIRALVIPEGQAAVADHAVKQSEVAATVAAITLKSGQSLDFVVDCQGNESCDGFDWAPLIQDVANPARRWSAMEDFRGPVVTSWQRYAQALLMTNEFVFVD
jgi:hypothetical protein